MEIVRDPGAARERTWLAWQRTAIVIAANGILLLRSPDRWIGVSAILVICAAPWIAFATSSSVIEHLDDAAAQGRGRRNIRILLGLAIGVSALNLIAILRSNQ